MKFLRALSLCTISIVFSKVGFHTLRFLFTHNLKQSFLKKVDYFIMYDF